MEVASGKSHQPVRGSQLKDPTVEQLMSLNASYGGARSASQLPPLAIRSSGNVSSPSVPQRKSFGSGKGTPPRDDLLRGSRQSFTSRSREMPPSQRDHFETETKASGTVSVHNLRSPKLATPSKTLPSSSSSSSSSRSSKKALTVGGGTPKLLSTQESSFPLKSQVSQDSIITRIRRNADFQFLFAAMGLALMIVQNELAWYWNSEMGYGSFCPEVEGRYQYGSTLQEDIAFIISQSISNHLDCDARARAQFFPLHDGLLILNILRGIISLTTFISLVFLFRYYAALLDYRKYKNLTPEKTSLMGSVYLRPIILETLIMSIHVFPGIDTVSEEPAAYLFFNLAMFLRLFLILRLLRRHSVYNSPNGNFIAALTNVEIGTVFVLKSLLKHSPFRVLGITFLTILCVSGYCIRYIETAVCTTYLYMECQPIGFWDAVWMLCNTMLTIGFADILPAATPSRVIVMLSGLLALLIVASAVAVMNEQLQLSRAETKVVTFLKKYEYRMRTQVAAVLCIQAAFLYHRSVKAQAKKATHKRLFGLLLKRLRAFRELRRWIAAHDPTDLIDKQITTLESIELSVDDIKTNLEAIGEFLLAHEEDRAIQRHLRGDAPRLSSGSVEGIGAGGGPGHPASRSVDEPRDTMESKIGGMFGHREHSGDVAAANVPHAIDSFHRPPRRSHEGSGAAADNGPRRSLHRADSAASGNASGHAAHSERQPFWVTHLRQHLSHLSGSVGDLNHTLRHLRRDFEHHVIDTHRRLNALESKKQMG